MTTEASKANILIVDDLPEKILVYQTILENLGQNLVTARSGEEALKQVLQREFAVILLDVNMPSMDGFETASLIRSRKRSAHTPIIFVTAFADDMRVAEGYAHGAVDYILTPVVPEVLRAKVQVFVNLFQMTEQVRKQADERLALIQERTRREAAEESNRRLEFLAKAGAILGRSLDFDATIFDLAKLVVPYLADDGIVAVPMPGSAWRVVKSRLAPNGAVDTEVVDGLAPLPADLAAAIQRVNHRHPNETLSSSSRTRGATAVIQALAPRGQTLAVLALTMNGSDRRFGPGEMAMARALAGRAAIALDNARLYQDVQQADRQKNEFLSMLAHELRNPLAPIRSGVEVLRMLDSGDAKLAMTRDIIDRQVGHLVRLVDDLLDVSRITQGKIRLQCEVIDVATIVASAVEISRPLIEARRHQLTVSLPPEPLALTADPIRLAQILSNLLNNAGKYTEQGGHIWLSVTCEDSDAVFRVRDTGIGIPAEMLSKIFDLFTQADRALDRSQGGLGIGLTLVRYLVEMHGGAVEARSDGPGSGSEFVIRIPAICTERAETVPADRRESDENSVRRILIVDDNVDAAQSLGVLLRFRGNHVELAYDGHTAIEMAKRIRPEIVLLDIGLPGMDGYEVVKLLRSDEEFRNTLIIAVTGYGQEEDRQQALAAGFNCHLTKPVNIIELSRMLQSLANARSNGESMSIAASSNLS